MGIGVGIILAVVGAILLTNAIAIPSSWPVDNDALGLILLVAGIVALGLAVYLNRRRNDVRTTHVEERRYQDPR
ncbi:hypothetical protein [Solicola sp. PLA-1-18]|uniref:hypothetical protein n=1 Tax=Solicola sp. PLA-1-18 TaxID=3380532 RepID=UPI003B823648